MNPEQARRAIDNGHDVYTPSRETAREIAGKRAEGPEIHLRDGEIRFPHYHRPEHAGGHIFFGEGEVMSEVLMVVMEGVALSDESKRELEHLFRTAAIATAAQALINSVRMVFRHEALGTTVEPFAGTASFRALLDIQKRRQEFLLLTSLLVEFGFHFSSRVGVIVMKEGETPPETRTEVSLNDLRMLRRIRPGSWFDVQRDSRLFHFPQVEARLLQPLKLRSDQLANAYFREFWAQGQSLERACDYVRSSVVSDQALVVSLGSAETVHEESRAQRDGVVQVGGRIYFLTRIIDGMI